MGNLSEKYKISRAKMDCFRRVPGRVPGKDVGPLAKLPSQQGGCGKLRNDLYRGQRS